MPFLIPKLRNDVQQDAVLQPNSRYNHFSDAGLLDNFQENDGGRYDDVGAVRAQAQVLNPLFERHGAKFLNQSLQFFGGHLLAAVLGEYLFSQLTDNLDASAGADANIDLLIPDLLLEPPLSGIHIFRDQLVEPFFSGLFIQDLQKAHAAHRIAFGAEHSAVAGQHNFDASPADIDQQRHFAFQIDRFFDGEMNQPRFFPAVDDRNFDSRRLRYSFQSGSAVCRFAQGAGSDCFHMRHPVFLQMLLKIDERLQHPVDRIR